MTIRSTRARFSGHMMAAACCVVVIAQLWSAPTTAQSPFQQSQRGLVMEPSKPLALPQDPPIVGRLLKGTAFFVDQSGYMLTARHAVEHCARIVIAKEQHRVQARIIALSAKYDLALIKVSKTLGLAAVFPRTATASANEMVFANAYDALPRMRDSGVLANSRVDHDGSEPGHLIIDSPVTHGASGAPVLDKRGLVQGVISRRTRLDRVLAVGLAETKAFLAANGVHFEQDDRPQVSPFTPSAERAASISAHVTCLTN
ncbi:serine protease [Hyphomicrobium sp. xq]|uniref:Serine protease n=2 Tax=Hyphomicrobium album TaxID=2665159 RepID=A0A6I3KJI2_9HYPH|nr:serine protease [Hyphomicrobium album]